MKITLDHAEIDQALTDYVRNQGLNVNPGDIEIEVGDGKISASMATSFLMPAAPQEADKQDGAVEDLDREELKTRLDQRGVTYAPKARTSTLQTLVEETAPVEAETEEPAPFVTQAEADAEKETPQPEESESEAVEDNKEDESPFAFGSGSADEAVKSYDEDEEDNRPLFGT